ncbi:Gp41 protein [Listeria monocytogenes str. Scott A]|nr:Gp41 protein [Listeria monocytogenes str. Scott A]
MNKNKVKAKQIIKNAKSIDEMTYQINTQTDFHIVVEEATGWQQ